MTPTLSARPSFSARRSRLLSVVALCIGVALLARFNSTSIPTTQSQSASVLLQSSLDDAASITDPAVGLGGSTTLSAADFVAGQQGSAANFADGSKHIIFPAASTDGAVQNIALDQGEIEFWYRPDYAAAADDVRRTLVVVGDIYNPPNLVLEESDRLTLRLTDAGFTSYGSAAGYRAPLWQPGEWVHIRATWNQALDFDALALYVNDTRVDEPGTASGWNLGSEIDIGSIFVGAANATGDFFADGAIDELIIRDAPGSGSPPASPTATATATDTAPAPPSPTTTATATDTAPSPASPTPTATPDDTTPPPDEVGITDPDLVVTPAPLALPPVGEPFTDPVFGTTLRRVSDSSGTGGFASHEYSQLQAFSPDNMYVLLTGSEGYHVRRVADLRLLEGLDTGGWNAARWYDATTLIHFDDNADTTLRVQLTDVTTGATETIYTFPAPYARIATSQSSDELSRDSRWLAGLGRDENGAGIIFALDTVAGTLGAELPIADLYAGPCEPDPTWGAVEPDWIGVSPLGTALVVQWTREGTTRCSGLETFDIQSGAFVGRLNTGRQHGDMGIDTDGSEFFMTFELSSPLDPNRPALSVRGFPGVVPVREPEYLRVLDWGNTEHISCQGPPGVCLVTAGRIPDDPRTPFEGEVFVHATDGSVRRLAHHRSSSCGYWVQPRASLSADGRYAIFASDWGRELDCGSNGFLGRGDPYIIDLEQSTPPDNPPTAAQRVYLPFIVQGRSDTPDAPTATPRPTSTPAPDAPTATPTPTSTPAPDAPTATPTPTSTTAPDAPTATPTDTAGGAVTFSQQPIDTSVQHGQHVNVVDIDQDGDQDSILALSLDDSINLYLNNGGATGWTTAQIAPADTIVAMETTVIDMDNDGDLDVAAVGLFDRGPCGWGSGAFCEAPGVVVWYENPGDVTGTWTRHPVSSEVWGARTIAAADLTGDDLPDLVVGAVALFGQPDGLTWFSRTAPDSWSAPRALDAALSNVNRVLTHDIDADGVPDVVASSTGASEIVWYENGRAPGATESDITLTRHVLATPPAPYDLHLAHLDDDMAQMELAVTSGAGLVWYDPPPDPRGTWAANSIAAGFGTGENARVVVADFNLDGVADVAVSSNAAAALRWYTRSSPTDWTGTDIGGYSGVTSLATGDLDGNNRPDLVSTTYENDSGSDRLDWWRNIAGNGQ